MTTTAINLPLYRALRSLEVPEGEAAAAAEAAIPDLSQLATKEDLSRMATRDDLQRMATKDDLLRMASKDDLQRMVTKDEMRADVAALRTEIAGIRVEMSQASSRQTKWLAGAIFAGAGLVIASSRLPPPTPSTDAIRAVVEQTLRTLPQQPAPPLAPAPRLPTAP